MKHYVGLDVAMKETAICIVDDERRIVREGASRERAQAIAAFLIATGLTFERVGIEAGPLAPWLCDGLAAAGLPVICIDARHMKAAVSAMPVKTDRIDARNIAFAMQVGWYRPVHLKRPEGGSCGCSCRAGRCCYARASTSTITSVACSRHLVSRLARWRSSSKPGSGS